MSETDKSDELEYASLQSSISSAERALRSVGGSSLVLRNFLENARARMGFVEKKIKEAQEKDARVEEDARAFLTHKQEVERETALSESEKQTYDSFLREDFFTKKDFARLDQFYSTTWDRLTESGKTEMSHRIWEGIRRDEYTFGELPKSVREKETEQAYKLLRDPSKGPESVLAIPERDRNDFLRCYESNKKEEASRILERESFKQNMNRDATPGHDQAKAILQPDAKLLADKSAQREATADERPKKAVANTEIDLSGVNLDGLKLGDAPTPSSANIPTAPALAKDTVTRG